MTNAPLLITLSLLVKTRQTSERFQPTITSTETWTVDTTLSAYKADLDTVLAQVWTYAQAQRAANITTEVACHYSLRIENVTAPAPPKGALVQAKQHYDGALSDGDFTSSDAVKVRIINAMDNIIALARY